MHLPSLIELKRDGGRLTTEQIRAIITGFTRGEVPEYQMAALAMAIYFRGMDAEETAALTEAMLYSGSQLHWPTDAPLRVDKHSSGGIGDKTSFILTPLLACDGLWVPMICGRSLGITGGTLDKLESIPGFRTQLSEEEISETVSRLGCVIVGQTPQLCPADKKLYALRDVTGTVPSIPLITASIMSKKLAEGLQRLVLDVKFGSGAFMPTRDQAAQLGQSLQAVGDLLGVHATVCLNDMNEPTGESVGNALEVVEAVRCLHGQGPADLEALVLDLATKVSNSPRSVLAQRLHDGCVWQKFCAMVEAQGGRADQLEAIGRLHQAPVILEYKAPRSGRLTRMDAGTIGRACLALGSGRAKADDAIDYAVGCDQLAKIGTDINAGDVLLRIHARRKTDADAATAMLLEGVAID